MKTSKHISTLSSCLGKKYILGLLAGLLGFVQHPAAQISEGGTPYSFIARSLGPPASYDLNVTLKNPPPIMEIDTTEGDTAYFYNEIIGEVFPAGVSPLTHGTWTTLPNGDQVWRLKITANAGVYMMLVFNDFFLPKGTSLFVYSEDQTRLIGAFTSRNNTPQNKFTTAPLKCNSLVLEYYKPHYVSQQEKLSVNSVGLVTKDFGDIVTKELGSSADCMINVKCPQYENWCYQRRSVALIVIVNEAQETIGWCSGALLNNERQDGKPFLLTAFHCLDLNEPKKDEIDQGEKDALQNWVFVFNYQGPGCDDPSTEPSMLFSITGAEYIASHKKTDYALVQLNQKPPRDYNVYYNGWSNQEDDMTNTGMCIHHPAGDIKKISEWDKRPDLKVNYWKVKWTEGSTQGGSSGSPMFNNSGYIVGQNSSARYNACDDSKRDFFGRFDKSWHNFGLNTVLNPNGDFSGSFQTYIGYMSGDETCKEAWYFAYGNDLHTSANVSYLTLASPGSRQYDGVYNARNTVIAEVVTIQTSTSVTFEAGHYVDLKPGFHAKPGSVFTAAIADCERGCGNGYKKKADDHTMFVSHSKPRTDEPVLQQTGRNLDQTINVYPNTSSGIFTVELQHERTITEIRVYDLQGRLIKKIPASSNKVTIDITSQPAGLYLLHVASGSETGTSRVIVTGNK